MLLAQAAHLPTIRLITSVRNSKGKHEVSRLRLVELDRGDVVRACIEQLTLYALALSRLTGIGIYQFKCARFDDEDYFEFYPDHLIHP